MSPCNVVKLPNSGIAFVRHALKRQPKCRWCDRTSTKLCDFDVSSPQQVTHRKTCDAPMCDLHAKSVGPNRDFCPDHQQAKRIEEDETVMAAIAEGRHADDIYLIDCPYCGIPSYWNQGSHCTCRKCGREIAHQSDDAYTLQDYWETAVYPCDEGAGGS